MSETATRFASLYPAASGALLLYRLAGEPIETFKQVYDDRFASRYEFWWADIERTLVPLSIAACQSAVSPA